MNNSDFVVILSADEAIRRLDRVRSLMADAGMDAIVVSDNANKYYITGRIFIGYILITVQDVSYFVKRPVHLRGDKVYSIRKPENIGEILTAEGINVGAKVGFELNQSSYGLVSRLMSTLGVSKPANADSVLMAARSVKTEVEIDKIRVSSDKLAEVYSHIPGLYRPGMSDVELQIEIERITRLHGGLGQFRMSGEEMEFNQGSVLTGDNADAPSPYDFAMGGAGVDPSLPVGADGSIIHDGQTVMVDTNGDFTGYMTDMTRTFACGDVSELAKRAHATSINICRTLAEMGRPGAHARYLYETALDIATEAGLADYFMGHTAKAGFVGHGVGISINELPVIAPRSKDILQENNVIALEPKFVIPHVGAVGIENTYVVRTDGMHCLTHCDEALLQLEP